MYKSIENTQPAIGCGEFVKTCENSGAGHELKLKLGAEGVKVGQAVTGGGGNIVASGDEPPRVVHMQQDSDGTVDLILNRPTTGTVTSSACIFTPPTDCKNGFGELSQSTACTKAPVFIQRSFPT